MDTVRQRVFSDLAYVKPNGAREPLTPTERAGLWTYLTVPEFEQELSRTTRRKYRGYAAQLGVTVGAEQVPSRALLVRLDFESGTEVVRAACRAPRNTLSGRCISVLGARRALMVMTYVSLWSMYRATEGGDPERVEELADAIGRDRSTVFRWQKDFREVFPAWETPADLLDYAEVHKVVNVRQAGALPIATA